MPVFGSTSKRRLGEVHLDLRMVMREAIKHYDFAVLCGHRGEAEQDDAFLRGHSGKQWPHSRHNAQPSLAVDIAPWPIDWNNLTEFAYMAGVVMACASTMGIELRWGGRWRKLKDMPHFELVKVNRPEEGT